MRSNSHHKCIYKLTEMNVFTFLGFGIYSHVVVLDFLKEILAIVSSQPFG